jgi:hypothetical protein
MTNKKEKRIAQICSDPKKTEALVCRGISIYWTTLADQVGSWYSEWRQRGHPSCSSASLDFLVFSHMAYYV